MQTITATFFQSQLNNIKTLLGMLRALPSSIKKETAFLGGH